MSLLTIEQEIGAAESELSAEKKRHHETAEAINKRLNSLRGQQAILLSGLDLELVKTAEGLLSVGSLWRNGEVSDKRLLAVDRAIRAIRDSATPMSKEYIGVKIYSGFGEQQEDHKYGYGPGHGSIVFDISSLVRDREWTEDERSAALYYLLHLKDIQEAKRNAA